MPVTDAAGVEQTFRQELQRRRAPVPRGAAAFPAGGLKRTRSAAGRLSAAAALEVDGARSRGQHPTLVDYDSADVAAVFGRAAAAYDSVIPFFARFGERLVELANLRDGESVIDVGTGRGAALLPAAARVGPEGTVLGVDLAEEMLALLRREIEERGIANATVRRTDAEALDVADDAFDVALSGFVLHLLPHPDAGAAELRRVVRPGGRVVASVPTGAGDHWAFLGRLFRRFGPRATRPVAVPARPEFDLAAVLAAGGLHVVHDVEEQIEFVFADERAWWEWAWSHGLRALLEALEPADLEELREEAFAALAALRRDAGIVLLQRARFVRAEKEAGRP